MWHEKYEQAPIELRSAVNEAYRAVCNTMEAEGYAGYPACGDDRAESLVAAIYRFLNGE
jgi:hypothetical protein